MTIYPTPESLEHHAVVPREQWLIARTELLKEEKEFTRLRDKINARRRDLPWVRVEKNYVFQDRNGSRTLADLFEGRSQLFVKHFMFAPGYAEINDYENRKCSRDQCFFHLGRRSEICCREIRRGFRCCSPISGAGCKSNAEPICRRCLQSSLLDFLRVCFQWSLPDRIIP
jgi:Bacterial protein of unknown function (DUF899)